LTGLTGYKPYRINSQGSDDGLIDNQLKPALSMWGLMKLIFKTYGYSITSDFMNTPWMKTLYMYGYYGSEKTKFSYKIDTIQSLPLEGVELIYSGSTVPGSQLNIIICKRGTGIPCFSTQEVPYAFANMFPFTERGTIPASTSGLTITAAQGFDFGFESGGVPVADISTLKYAPKNVGDSVSFVDGDFVNFNLVIDENIKQIDLLSSIAKKFNLVFIPDPDNPKNIIIESYPYYVGTGNIYDWTPKLSYDKGFTVEPALNYIESNIVWTDQEDGDYGNKQFKDRNKQIYGQKNFYGPTNFKSEEKKIDTIFSPELLRQWDTADQLGADVSQGIKLPLGINYVGSSSTKEVGNTTETYFAYKGLKSKPKLFWFLGSSNLFLDTLGEAYAITGFTTYDIRILSSDKVNGRSVKTAPIISHTMPMGMKDSAKINNDSACILFNSEQPVDVGVTTYNTYTDNDAYALFYSNRIDNLYDVNTRFIRGYFDLKLSDINNLKTNDVIKIQEQYFIVNKINGFNLTNRELTEVELVQYNLNPQQYPTRYFKYQYCDAPGYCFKIKTDFTNPRLIDTQFGWSVWYDQSIGTFTGSTTPTGFTSCILDSSNGRYVPFTISEITKDEYDNGGCYDISCDTLIQFEWNFVNIIFPNVEYAFGLGLPSFWQGTTAPIREGLNLWSDCASFQTARAAYGILTGSSINHGYSPCMPTPTPIPSPTPTPTPTPTPLPEYTGATYLAYTNFEGNPYYSTDFGYNFTAVGFNRRWKSISSNETNQYIYACSGHKDPMFTNGFVYKSSDYGATYGTIDGLVNRDWNLVASSKDSSKVFASALGINGTGTGSTIFYSSDSGNTFTNVTSTVKGIYTNTNIEAASLSRDGKFQSIVVGKVVANSSNTGSTFNYDTTLLSSVVQIDQTDISDDGTYQSICVVNSGFTSVSYYLSTNSGSTYTNNLTINGAAGFGFQEIKSDMSSNGQYHYVSERYTGLWVSNNYGASGSFSNTFTVPSNTIISGVRCTNLGQFVYIIGKNATGTVIYRSTNFGTTFSLLFTGVATVNFQPLLTIQSLI
jgi:hypothetical protein